MAMIFSSSLKTFASKSKLSPPQTPASAQNHVSLPLPLHPAIPSPAAAFLLPRNHFWLQRPLKKRRRSHQSWKATKLCSVCKRVGIWILTWLLNRLCHQAAPRMWQQQQTKHVLQPFVTKALELLTLGCRWLQNLQHANSAQARLERARYGGPMLSAGRNFTVGSMMSALLSTYGSRKQILIKSAAFWKKRDKRIILTWLWKQ